MPLHVLDRGGARECAFPSSRQCALADRDRRRSARRRAGGGGTRTLCPRGAFIARHHAAAGRQARLPPPLPWRRQRRARAAGGRYGNRLLPRADGPGHSAYDRGRVRRPRRSAYARAIRPLAAGSEGPFPAGRAARGFTLDRQPAVFARFAAGDRPRAGTGRAVACLRPRPLGIDAGPCDRAAPGRDDDGRYAVLRPRALPRGAVRPVTPNQGLVFAIVHSTLLIPAKAESRWLWSRRAERRGTPRGDEQKSKYPDERTEIRACLLWQTRFRGQSGKHVLVPSLRAFDRKQTLWAPVFGRK